MHGAAKKVSFKKRSYELLDLKIVLKMLKIKKFPVQTKKIEKAASDACTPFLPSFLLPFAGCSNGIQEIPYQQQLNSCQFDNLSLLTVTLNV